MVWFRSVKTMHGDYYNWLVDLIEAGPGTAHEDYTSLIHELYLMKYRWQFELDENRAIAGLALRDRYAYEAGVDRAEMSDGPCSVLEMLIGLADVMSQTFDDTVSRWFWEMIGNLHLDHFSDGNYDSYSAVSVVNRWLDRRFSSNGNGSIFPIPRYHGDARNLQVWDAMNEYMNEFYPLDKNWLK